MTIRLHGGRVTLRAFHEGEFEVVWGEESRDRGPHEEPWPQEAKDFLRARTEVSGEWRKRTSLLLAVEADGRLVGDVQARRSHEVFPPGLYELGIGLFADARGKGYGVEALQVLTRYLFDEEQAGRVQMGTDLDNVAMRRAAEKAGFTCEGVMRGYWPATGETPSRDFALYGITRADHLDGKTGWTSGS